MSHVKLKRLKINKYRNVRPGTELHFDDGVNLILGQNGSGKTTLLGLIAAVAGNNFSISRNEPFDLEYVLSNGISTSSVQVRDSGDHQAGELFQNGATEGDDDTTFGANTPPAQQRSSRSYYYKAILTTEGDPRAYEVEGTPEATIISISGEGILAKVRPFAPSQADFLVFALLDDYSALTKPAYEVAVSLAPLQVFRFDESLDTFLAMTGREPALRIANAAPVSAFRVASVQGSQGPATWRRRVFTPMELVAAIHEAHSNPAGELRLRSSHEDTSDQSLDFLDRATRTIGFRNATMRPEIKLVRAPPGAKHQYIEGVGFSFSFTRDDGTTIHHDLLSYGQKRLLAYFYYLAATDDVVIADELVNGLHHRWIEACMKAIGERQAFLTSQNPLLFDYVEFDSIKQVQARFITCKTEIVDGAEQLVWQNMPRDDAARFYEAYSDEIEQVGEILITRGLW